MSDAESRPRSPRVPIVLGKLLRSHAVELSLCFFLWFAYGVTVNSRNQYEFNLQHAGIEAIVERHHFYLEGSSTPRLQMHAFYDGDKPFGDVFLHGGHQYAAKQPGQFMLGAIVYFFLRLLGLDYLHHYSATSALVSFLTSSLVTALAAWAVFRTAAIFAGEHKLFWALVCALIYGLGTTAFVYAGIAYHDALASGFLVIAFYCAVLLTRRAGDGTAQLLGFLCGLLLGATVATSMLPFFMACIVGVYVLSLRRWRLAVALLLGGIVGIAPLLVFNWISFGNPLLNSYAAGGYPESMLHFDWLNTVAKARLYAAEITLYVPVGWLGLLGLAFFPRVIRREQLVIVFLLIAQAFQVLNIESHGGCHYGPRFLLPAMPFLCLGLSGFSYLKARAAVWSAMTATVLVGAISGFISAMGAIYTAMYCDVGQYALGPALQNLRSVHSSDFQLALWLVVPLVVSLSLLIRSTRRSGVDLSL
jgi:hypothetical protein